LMSIDFLFEINSSSFRFKRVFKGCASNMIF
jgi:hypothetical protein